MKLKLLFISILTFSATRSFSQTYMFTELVKSVMVQTSSGNQMRVISTTQGPFNIKFESPNDPQIKKLFTVMKPGQYNTVGLPWYGLLEERGYVEKQGKLLKKSLYYDTEDDATVQVLIADDYSVIVILKNDDTIWEYFR